MKKNKLIIYIFFLLFITISSLLFWKNYYSFHKNNTENLKIEKSYIEENNNFSIEDIEEIKEIYIKETPDKELLEQIVDMIDNAKEKIYLEMYMFTETRIRNSIIKAHNRWVDVKVLLEKNPYLATNINNNAYEELKKKQVNISWSNTNNYALNHSKMIIIDDLVIISTGNFTYSSFTQNRDIFIFIEEKELVKNFLELFDYDFNWIKKWVINKNIVLSPINSRDKITKLLESAENNIKMQIPYFSDNEIVDKIIEIKNKKDLDIKVIIPTTAIEDENTKKLIQNWIRIFKIPKYKLHSKAILVDDKVIFIWSLNFSYYSFNKNREIWIFTKNQEVINKFIEIFYEDIID